MVHASSLSTKEYSDLLVARQEITLELLSIPPENIERSSMQWPGIKDFTVHRIKLEDRDIWSIKDLAESHGRDWIEDLMTDPNEGWSYFTSTVELVDHILSERKKRG
jgi:hypothetical protein